MEHYLGLLAIILTLLTVVLLLLVGRPSSDKRVNVGGYVVTESKSGQSQYEHRAIAERVLGRHLQQWEVVHHINGRRNDNRPSNLCVMDRHNHDRYHQWYDWIFKTYGKYPRRETQLKKIREDFSGKLLDDYF